MDFITVLLFYRQVEYRADRGWGKPRICPMHDLVLHPATKALHYAVQLFEGMKAYRGFDDKIRLFRPEMNVARFESYFCHISVFKQMYAWLLDNHIAIIMWFIKQYF